MKEIIREISVKGKKFHYYSLEELNKKGWGNINGLPYSLKVLLENLARHCDNVVVKEDEIKALCNYQNSKPYSVEVSYHPARVLMQDFTGVPAVVDLATMRDAIKAMGGNAQKINPLSPVDLVIDHSVSVEKFGTSSAFKENVEIEFSRNQERYEFLRWGQGEFKNFRVVPPGTGICHQVNLEYLAKVVWTKDMDGKTIAYPDTLVGTDSHTTMINGLAVLGWGVGGIEAEAAMLGQPVTMLIPQVVGFKLTGKLKEGITATDLVLTVVQMLRKKGVVDKFVEFYGDALDSLSLADRATIANMAPEYGATCGFFPIDSETINYLKLSGRDEETIELVEKYAKAQGMWREKNSSDPIFLDTIELDVSSVEPCISGPSRPQDRILLKSAPEVFKTALKETFKQSSESKKSPVNGKDFDLDHGRVVLASITSCTNTSNPSVLIAAGLLAKKAWELGLKSRPWVKTSLAPGSQVVTDYLSSSGLQKYLDHLGFNLVGYGCTTCIGNSGPLPTEISESINKNDLVACAVLSGNRNFEGRISPDIKANFLASPPLVVAYAIAGSININLTKDVIGKDKNGKDVFLKDIWPTDSEIKAALNENVTRKMFQTRYQDVFKGPIEWQQIKVGKGETYKWDEKSTYIKKAPYFNGMKRELTPVKDILKARPLAILGDSVTTDHISPAGNIAKSGPAGKYLTNLGVAVNDFNSYGARRGNHEVMMRGTFANIRIKNEMLGGVEGGLSKHIPTGEQNSIYDVSIKYQNEGTPLVIFAGKEYGTGSSRDWAGKGTNLLGIKAVIAESFERIHRSNLIGMGVLPLVFTNGQTRKTLNLDGTELVDIVGLEKEFKPQMKLKCRITRQNGKVDEIEVQSRINTPNELDYFKNGGILHFVLRNLTK